MADVFISYSRRDQDFVRRLHEALVGAGRETWVDWEGIPPSAKWMDEVRAAIDAADAFVFVVSPDSAGSPVCRDEADHALAVGKRIVPVVWRDTPEHDLPAAISAHNWLTLREGDDFEAGFARLLGALDTDLEWVKEHTRLVTRARDWEASGRERSRLLRGRDLGRAEQAVARADRDPRPTPLQTSYVLASRASERRGARIRTALLSGGLVVALVLAGFALLQRNTAEQNATLAEQQRQVAEEQRAEAEANADLAFGRELAHAALEQLDTDPEVSILLALEGVEVSRTTETDQALRRAVQASLIRELHPNDVERIYIARFTPDGRHVLAGGHDGQIWRLDPTGADPPVRLGDARSGIESLAISKDGELALALSNDGYVRVWRGTGGPPLEVLVDPAGAYTVSLDEVHGQFIAGGVAGVPGRLRRPDGREARGVHVWRRGRLCHDGEPGRLARRRGRPGRRGPGVEHDGLVADPNVHGRGRHRDHAHLQPRRAPARRRRAGPHRADLGHGDGRPSRLFRRASGGRQPGAVQRGRADGGHGRRGRLGAAVERRDRRGHRVVPRAAGLSDGRGGARRTCPDAHQRRCHPVLGELGGRSGCGDRRVRWRHPGPRLVARRRDVGGRIVRSHGAAMVRARPAAGPVFRGHTAPATSVAFSPDGTRVASVGFDGLVSTFDVAASSATVVADDLPELGAVAFTGDGRSLIVGGADAARLIDVASGE